MEAHTIDEDQVAPFVLAGRAVFTLRSRRTGARFTYKISKARKERTHDKTCWFVSVLTGPGNESDYSYLGYIRGERFTFQFTFQPNRSNVGATAPSVQAITWFLGRLFAGRDLPDLEVWHEGRCGRCGRTLTVPESISSGFGPECIGRLDSDWIRSGGA